MPGLRIHVSSVDNVPALESAFQSKAMWMIRQLNLLTEILKTELGAIRKSIQEQVSAIRDASKASIEGKKEPLPVLAELQIPEADKTEQRAQHDQNYALQVWLTLGTWLAFGAAALYAGIAAHQATIMNETLCEVRKQSIAAHDAAVAAQKANDLTVSLIKGEQQAIVDLTIPSQPDSLSQIAAGLSAQFVNNGKVNAIDFKATVTLQRVSLPSFSPIGKAKTMTIARQRILPLSGGHSGLDSVALATFDMSGMDEADIASIKAQSTTFKWQIAYSYGNGFGDTISNEQCFLYLDVPADPKSHQAWNSWDECGMAMNVYRGFFRRR